MLLHMAEILQTFTVTSYDYFENCDDPGLSGWALSAVTGDPVSDRQRELDSRQAEGESHGRQCSNGCG